MFDLKKVNSYLSVFLLVVFAWVITPTHTIHDLFADHHDTADNYCATHHSHLGTHIEEQHTHCDILKLDSPVYQIPQMALLGDAPFIYASNGFIHHTNEFVSYKVAHIPARAPPAFIA